MRIRTQASTVGLLVAAALVFAGCGKSPLSPGSAAGLVGMSTPPPVAHIETDGTVSYVWAPVAAKAGEALPDSGPHPCLNGSGALVDGAVGGEVRAGRFSVKIPPGAFSGAAVVTVTMPDSTVMICDLEIAPATANHFQVPVELTADLTSSGLTDASGFTMYWYDTMDARWVNLFAKSRVSGCKVTTHLDHFSKYAAGKVGW